MRPPLKPTTPAEVTVIVFMFAGAMIACGTFGLWKAAQLPASKAEIAAELNHYGSWSLGLGLALIALYFLIRRFWP